jgi:RimJ/RimL family protein N-acetyltransferase
VSDWRRELPALTSRFVTLREVVASDLGPIYDLLSTADASRFGLEEPLTELGVRLLIDRAHADRGLGVAFTYAITLAASRTVIGLVHVKQLDMLFESAEWDMTIAPSARGTGAFLEAARAVGSFAFDVVGVHRLETRALVQNGRANGALRKLGAVQEGILRRAVRRNGKYMDMVLWSLLKDDWGDLRVSTAPRVH